MPTIQELREGIQKQDVILSHIKASIIDIEQNESLLFRQCMSGTFDRLSDEALRQKMQQLDAYREDRQSLIEQKMEIEADRYAMCEEAVNSFRRKVGMPDLNTSDFDQLITEVLPHDDAVGGRHPGARSAVVNHKKPS